MKEEPSAFVLVTRPEHGVAIPWCSARKFGATISFALELTWRLGNVTCSECATSTQFSEDDIRGMHAENFSPPQLRGQYSKAMIDVRLMSIFKFTKPATSTHTRLDGAIERPI